MPTNERVKKDRIAKMEALISGLLKKNKEERARGISFGLRRPILDPGLPMNGDDVQRADPYALMEEVRTLGKTCHRTLGQILSKTPAEERVEFISSVAAIITSGKNEEENSGHGIGLGLPYQLLSSLVGGLVKTMKARKNEMSSDEFKQGINALISLNQGRYYHPYSLIVECKSIAKENPEYMLSILPELVKQNIPVDLEHYFKPEYWNQAVGVLEEIGPRGMLAAARVAVKSDYGEAGVDGRARARGHVPAEIAGVLWPAVERAWDGDRENRGGDDTVYSALSDLGNDYFYPWSDQMKLRLLKNSVNEKIGTEARLKDLVLLTKAESLSETEILSLMGHPLLGSEHDSKRKDGVEIISALFRHPNLTLGGG